MMQSILFDGPWSVNGLVLQLFPWQLKFQPVTVKLSNVTIWVQIHHLPIEWWEDEMHEDIDGRIECVLKVDDQIVNINRARYRLRVEIDLSVPLKRGFWFSEDDDKSSLLYNRNGSQVLLSVRVDWSW